MSILCEEAERLVASGCVDEWHLWDFTRKPTDREWLRSRYPSVRLVPGNLSYVRLGELPASQRRFRCFARGRNDLHLAFRAEDDPSGHLEIVAGGWGNTGTAFRYVARSELVDGESDDSGRFAFRETPGILSADRFRSVVVERLENGALRLNVDGRVVLECPTLAWAGRCEVFSKAGYGADIEFRSAGDLDDRIGVFVGDPRHHPIYHQAYWHYVRHAREYADCVFLKCDDDIVSLDADRLGDFIRYRIDHPDYFLISANVVNNGVCAFYQQQAGAIPRGLMDLELPPGGFGGSLWSTPRLAATLHEHYLASHDAFDHWPHEVVEWGDRLSINFVSWLGTDLHQMYFGSGDDEQTISATIPQLLGRTNAIYMPFVVGHLSFYTQESGLDTGALIARYRDHAARRREVS